MVGLRRQDITKDILFIFVLCYEYKLNFTNVLKLYKISKRYFWVFLEIFNPMLKMGLRKAANMRKSVERMLPYAKNLTLETSKLTPKEDIMLESFNWFVQDSFSDGEGCLHISQFQVLPSIKGYRKDNSFVSSDAKVLEKYLDEVDYITLGSNKFSKISRILYYLEKYAGDLSLRELESLSVTDMIHKVREGLEENAV